MKKRPKWIKLNEIMAKVNELKGNLPKLIRLNVITAKVDNVTEIKAKVGKVK